MQKIRPALPMVTEMLMRDQMGILAKQEQKTKTKGKRR